MSPSPAPGPKTATSAIGGRRPVGRSSGSRRRGSNTANAQTLRKFVDLHFRYGRGAYLHHRRRLERGSGGIGRDVGFHASILPRLRALRGDRRVAGRALAILAAFGIWQGANAAGFAREALLGSRRPPPA